MRVAHHLRAQCGIARFRSIILRKGDKELLIAGKSLLLRRRLAAKRRALAVIRSRVTGIVSNFFRQRLLAID